MYFENLYNILFCLIETIVFSVEFIENFRPKRFLTLNPFFTTLWLILVKDKGKNFLNFRAQNYTTVVANRDLFWGYMYLHCNLKFFRQWVCLFQNFSYCFMQKLPFFSALKYLTFQYRHYNIFKKKKKKKKKLPMKT